MIRDALDAWPWHSQTILGAEVDQDGTVLRANPGLEIFAGRPLAGEPLESVVVRAQRAAFRTRLEAAGEGWTAATFGFAADPARAASDRTVWLRRSGDSVLVVAEPALEEQQRLVEKVLELNDDLVRTQRELHRERRREAEARQAAEHALERAAHLEAIATAGLTHTRLEDVLLELLNAIARAVQADRAVLLLLDPVEDVLVARAAVGIADTTRAGIRVPMGRGVAGNVAASRRPVVIPDLDAVPVVSAYLRETSRSMAAVPLILDREVIGVLHVTADSTGYFQDNVLALLVPAAERAAVAIARAQAHEREHDIAQTLQRALLPTELPPVPDYALAARFTPGAEVQVGGDWYDALPLPSGEAALVIGDVAGKGVSAAALMGELRGALRAYLLDGGPPQRVLAKLDRLADRSRRMATVLIVLLDPATGALRHAGAGHLPPLLIPAGGGARLLDGGRSTPLLAYREVEPGEARLDPGERLVLYTDGLVERRREAIDVSLARLVAAAGEIGGRGDLEHAVDALVAEMQPPADAARDDVAVIAIERLA